ncbi:Protein LOL2 [Linum perenne]
MENVSAESMEDIEPPPPGCQSISPSKPSVQPATLSPPPGWESIPPSQKSEEPATLPPPPSSPPPLPQLPPHPVADAEMAQMVCGSCQRLLSYPKGAKHVKCSCCETLNFVLQGTQPASAMVCYTRTPSTSFPEPCPLSPSFDLFHVFKLQSAEGTATLFSE